MVNVKVHTVFSVYVVSSNKGLPRKLEQYLADCVTSTVVSWTILSTKQILLAERGFVIYSVISIPTKTNKNLKKKKKNYSTLLIY